MANVLVVLEQLGGKLRTASLPAVTFGKQLAGQSGGQVSLLVLGQGTAAAATEAAQLGVKEVLTAEAPALEHYLAESYAPLVVAAAQQAGAQVIAATATATGKDLLPRVAGLLDCALVSDAVAILGPNKFRRPVMAGNVLLEVEATTPTLAVTVRQTEFAPAQPTGTAAPLRALAIPAEAARGAEFVSLTAAQSDRPELTEAKVVVSGGRGMREAKNFELLAGLADLLGGALGASRAACDAGMVPNDLQVGQTGKVVAPQLYIAVAISGAIQHLAGMKGSKTIVAINKDSEAPIFQVADYGLVALWEKAIPELIEAVKKLKAVQH